MLIQYTFFVISITLFLYGFFPVNITDTSKKPKLPSSIKNFQLDPNQFYYPEYDKLIFIIIDALRYDFINEKSTPFMWNISHSQGCLSEVQVETPTVTLPRIKALISGNVPQFVDIVLNLIRNEKISDSFLHRAVTNNKSIIFYGDDTWLTLCPELFKRYEGTSSFFVNDYTEVDNNVTRNVYAEMENHDWDIMILHYLGLDHIGHISGPFSNLIPLKLKEMDDIVKYIYNKVEKNKKSLILVTGDHGMKDSGGHGGSSFSETHVPLVAIGLNCTPSKISQIDVATTLASLFGLEIPHTSIGSIATNLLSSLSPQRLLYILHYNLLHLKNKADLCPEFNNITKAYYSFMNNYTNNIESLTQSYKHCSYKIAHSLRKSSTTQDMTTLIFSYVSMLNFLLICISNKLPFKFVGYLFVFYTIFQLVWNHYLLNCIMIILQLCFVILNTIFTAKYVIKSRFKLDGHVILCLLTLIQPVFFIASSFIEEEHQIWYYYGTTVVVVTILFKLQMHSYKILLLFIFRFIRKINQTGDKWASLPDIAFYLEMQANFPYFITYFLISLLILYLYCLDLQKFHKLNCIFITAIICCISLFQIYNKNVIIGQITWCLIFFNFLLNINYENGIVTWLFIAALLLRPYNIILLPFAIYTSRIIKKSSNISDTKTILHIWLGYVLFFCQGHSNSVSSIDIASGYTGLSEYNPIIVIVQVLCHTYAFPVLVYILAEYDVLYMNYFIIHRSISICFISFIVLLQRQHLFIWSVFAPKLLIEASHSFVLYIIVIIHQIFIKCNSKSNRCKLNRNIEIKL